MLTEEKAEYYKTRIPMGRIGTPEEMADIVAFLVSPKNSYMIGATVDVSGGMLSYGVIGVGVEARWGSCKYNGFSFDAAEGEAEPASFGKIKASGIRAYVSFRF